MADRIFNLRLNQRWLRGIVLFLCCLATGYVFACNIPVFRYALENWRTDPYYALIVSRGPLSDDQRLVVELLSAASTNAERPANLAVITIDLEKDDAAAKLASEVRGERAPDWLWQQWKERLETLDLTEPQMVVLYPHQWDRVAWQAALNESSASKLIDSPVRQEIANRLLAGQSAVWVLLESGDAERDDAAWQQLQDEVAKSTQTVTLPARELIEAEAEYRADIEIELRVDFSAIRLSRADADEIALDAMLRGSETDLRGFSDPIAIPIFGRGRTYFALVGKGIRGETIEENCQFLCGACSCQIKNENPGVDLLMAVNWADKIGGSAMPDIVLPELTGIGALDLSSSATDDADNSPLESQVVAAVVDRSSPANEVADSDADNGTARPAIDASDTETSLPTNDSADVLNETEPATPPVFERRLAYGLIGAIGVAVFFVVMATYALRQ